MLEPPRMALRPREQHFPLSAWVSVPAYSPQVKPETGT